MLRRRRPTATRRRRRTAQESILFHNQAWVSFKFTSRMCFHWFLSHRPLSSPDSNERGRQVTPGAEVDSGKSKALATSFVLIPKIKSKTNREGTPEKNIFSDLFRNEVSHPHTPDI